jgi:endo-1,4-beta-xylanase
VSDWEFHWAINPDKPFRPDRDSYDFSETDLLAEFAETNNLRLQGHHLLYGLRKSTPQWLRNGDYSREELLSIIEEHITTVVGRYKGGVHEWTVVNELLGLPWEPGNRFWYDRLGPEFDWLAMAFHWAHKADPGAELLLNDFAIEFPGHKLYSPDRDRQVFDLVRELKDKGVPIHGVGFQMHVYGTDFMTQAQLDTKAEALTKNIRKYANLGVNVLITEFDLRLDGVPGSQEERFELQGRVYGGLFRACLEAGVRSFAVFGLTDKYSWLEIPSIGGPDAQYTDPLPFDGNFRPKPAYYALLSVLQELYVGQRSG